MKIGVPKEIKTHEYRVGLVPQSVSELARQGHTVLVQSKAGHDIGFSDDDYISAGATLCSSAKDVYQGADMIVKVKEILEPEYNFIRDDQILFTFLHLAPDPQQTEALIRSNSVAIAYETVTDHKGLLPILTPSSEVAGRMSIQVGARFLEKEQGGAGVLLSGAPGVEAAQVTVVGGGVVGVNAARIALGMGARVSILDNNPARLRDIEGIFQSRVTTLFATHQAISEAVAKSDLVVGAVLVVGDEAPKIVTEDMIKNMRPGSVVVDVAIDQGGCFETSRPTSHDEPTYRVHNVIHYCVTNMPGAVARTSSRSLNNATLPFVRSLANKGYVRAMLDDVHLMNGLNIFKGKVVYEPVARALGYPYHSAKDLLMNLHK